MISFNDLKITADGKSLIIDVAIMDGKYFSKVLIDSIVIDNQDTFLLSGPSSKPIYTYTSRSSTKTLRLVLDKSDLGVPLDTNMLFVYAIAKGTPAPDIPCGLDSAVNMGVVINFQPIYKQSIKYISLIQSCEDPKDFIDFILQYKAIELCIRTYNYPLAIKYWKRFIKDRCKVTTLNRGGCGCYG